MRDIEGIERVLALLAPHWERIHEDFERENAQYKALITQDHDRIGRVLKCHLVVENYLGRFLAEHFGLATLDTAKLTFFQKAALLPDMGSAAAFVKPGILKLNAIRNRFGHTLQPQLNPADLTPIHTVLEIARAGQAFPDPIDAIEAFTTVACTWLLVPKRDVQRLFMDAFAEVRTHIAPEH